MYPAQAILIGAVFLLVLVVGIGETRRRRRGQKRQRALAKGQRLLRRLHCATVDRAHPFKSRVHAGVLATLLSLHCEETGITLEEVGTSQEELDKLCGRHQEGLLDK